MKFGPFEVSYPDTFNLYYDKEFKSTVCPYCLQKLSKKTSKWDYDHITPRRSNGKSEFDNLVRTCQTCNGSKGDMKLLKFLVMKNVGSTILNRRKFEQKKARDHKYHIAKKFKVEKFKMCKMIEKSNHRMQKHRA